MKNIDENRLLKIAGSVALLVVAFTFAYRYVVSPEIKQARLSNCLNGVQERKVQANTSNTAGTSSKSLYERYQAGGVNYQAVNVKAEQEECYKRYK